MPSWCKHVLVFLAVTVLALAATALSAWIAFFGLTSEASDYQALLITLAGVLAIGFGVVFWLVVRTIIRKTVQHPASIEFIEEGSP